MSLLNVHNLGKAYRTYRSELQRFARWFGLPVKPSEEHWVLRHVNFDIQPGEAIGIIGQNGAGKSTLLKMITGTLQPTEGELQVNGRIAAILELGMGFNPDLTGRQNVSHAAGLMGFSAEQIQQAMPDIEAFAEIGEYFDEPVRTYSSGMQMRAAFSVATAYRPEILIVDEALSVGDAYFQHKCASRIREFQEQGTTLLLVSHDRSAIQGLCDRALMLENGTVIKDGNPEEVFNFYNAIIAEKENSTVEVKKLKNGKMQTISGTGEAQIESIALLNEQAEPVEFVNVGEEVRLQIKMKINQAIPDLTLGYMIKDRLGQAVFGINTHLLKENITNITPGNKLEFIFKFQANLGIGSYSVTTALHSAESHLVANYEWKDQALIFQVVNSNNPQFEGVAWLPPILEIIE
jgi:lipopolysaccharide transport system ATP-binding protein